MRDLNKRRAANNAWSKRHREQHTVLNRAWRAANRDHVREYARAYREKLADKVRALKAGPCQDCGRKYHYSVMDFDHVRGRKKFNVGLAVNQHKAWRVLKAEIAKCELVCANCHRVRTWERRTGETVLRKRK